MDMIYNGTPETILMKSFDCLLYSDAFMKALVEKVRRYPAVAQDPTESMGRTTECKIEDGVENKKDEIIDPLLSETES